MNGLKYVGSELDLFAAARNWKTYWSAQLHPYMKGDVLEVGAGIGSNTEFLDPTGGTGRWVCLEPDADLKNLLAESLAPAAHKRAYEAVCGTLASLTGQQFDTIVYVDVLEHIEKDTEELKQAAAMLRPGGRVIVLSPAHQQLFSPFDAAIGHFRRYNRSMLRKISPPGLRMEKLIYLDAAGLALSLGNSLFLRQSMPTKAQLAIWDRWVIPISRILDRITFNAAGKTIVGIWRQETAK